MRRFFRATLALAPVLLWVPGMVTYVPDSWAVRMAIMLGAWGLVAASTAIDWIDRADSRLERGLDEPTSLNLNKT